jgi:predicted patatin/cPLA2 family phospholipase
MDIDTLIFSGGSVKGISFLGSINHLIEKGIIDKKFKNIKKIYCVSASILFVISLILLDYDTKILEEDMINFDYNTVLNINDISLKSFINEYGFINYNKTYIYIQKLLKEKYNCESISLSRLFKISNIHLVVKVVNVSQDRIEYIDHINNPKINTLKLIQMTTAIPLLVKPIKYKNDLYQDGGLSGNCPIEVNESENYLCIEILPNKCKKDINNILDYVVKGWDMYSPDILIRKYDKKNIKIDLSHLNIILSDFNIDNITKKTLLNEGYNQTMKHINHYLQQV